MSLSTRLRPPKSRPALLPGPGPRPVPARGSPGLPYLPPLPENEADLFDSGEAGHERIEQEALRPLVRDEAVLTAIYFGNWQRDMSQVLAPGLHQYLGSRAGLVCDLAFEIVDVLAEARFHRRLDRERFGTYRWEEHIDNPRGFGVAVQPATCTPVPEELRRRYRELEPERNGDLSLWREGADATPLYLQVARNRVLAQLALAVRGGWTKLGLEHLGNALHTVEDFYAHSNFIDLGYNLLRGSDPLTGWDPDGRPLRDSRGRFRLTTGIFPLIDTLHCLNKLFLHHLETRHGVRPSPVSREVNRVLVRRLLGRTALGTYDRLMRLWESTGIPAATEPIQQALEDVILHPVRLAVAGLLRPLAEAAARQDSRRLYPMPPGSPVSHVREITHSALSKDDPAHPQYTVARQLAIRAVRDFWCQIEAAWRGGATPDFPRLVNLYMNHPEAVGSWWVPVLEGRPLPAARCGAAPAPPPARTAPFEVLDRFTFDRASLTPRHLAEIERIAARLAGLPSPQSAVVRLVGHTDSSGTDAYNRRLGQARANAVQRALSLALARQPGQPAGLRFAVQSAGERQPVADNTTPQGRARNRRVEIFLDPARRQSS